METSPDSMTQTTIKRNQTINLHVLYKDTNLASLLKLQGINLMKKLIILIALLIIILHYTGNLNGTLYSIKHYGKKAAVWIAHKIIESNSTPKNTGQNI